MNKRIVVSEESKLTNRITDKYYAEMKAVEPNFNPTQRERMFIVSAVGLAVKEMLAIK